ncbi:MAG: DUF6261 family protein [Prevotellaceae bacterium]|nr:DUF6261 family protein [Prevotella sp.]MDD7257845.1 DUF6261 family protein [Prevotellaceae bacterium]MDY6130073.1 DUF6261 family protein [Prevotella sp.]
MATDKSTEIGGIRLPALASAVAAEDGLLMFSKKSPLTKEIETAYKERDRMFSGCRAAVKDFLRIPLKEMADAAAQLHQHLKDYGIDPGMQLERETSRIMNLVDDIKKKYHEQVEGALRKARLVTDAAYQKTVKTINALTNMTNSTDY